MGKLRWFGVNGAMAGLLWLGAVRGQVWAANVFLFVAWANLVVWLMVVGNGTNRARFRARGPCVPQWVYNTYSLGMVLALAGVGWFWTATAMSVGALCESGVYSVEDDPGQGA